MNTLTKKQIIQKIKIKKISQSRVNELFSGIVPSKKKLETLTKSNLLKLYKNGLIIENTEQRNRMKASLPKSGILKKDLELFNRNTKRKIELKMLKKELHETITAVHMLALKMYKARIRIGGIMQFYCRINKPSMKCAYDALPSSKSEPIDINAILTAMYKPMCNRPHDILFPITYYQVFNTPFRKLREIKHKLFKIKS